MVRELRCWDLNYSLQRIRFEPKYTAVKVNLTEVCGKSTDSAVKNSFAFFVFTMFILVSTVVFYTERNIKSQENYLGITKYK